jgi:hypothetical protein
MVVTTLTVCRSVSSSSMMMEQYTTILPNLVIFWHTVTVILVYTFDVSRPVLRLPMQSHTSLAAYNVLDYRALTLAVNRFQMCFSYSGCNILQEICNCLCSVHVSWLLNDWTGSRACWETEWFSASVRCGIWPTDSSVVGVCADIHYRQECKQDHQLVSFNFPQCSVCDIWASAPKWWIRTSHAEALHHNRLSFKVHQRIPHSTDPRGEIPQNGVLW